MDNNLCNICNSELDSLTKQEKITCNVCKKTFGSNKKCINGHFVCKDCKELGPLDYIEMFCKNNDSTNPVELAEFIMNGSNIKIHGPEHHFLIPAVLLTAYYNKIGEKEMILKKLKNARERSKNVLPGFCGYYGACGAGVGTGIFLSILLNSTPLSVNEWSLCGQMTATSLTSIASDNGPRCCKRVSYRALEAAINFIDEHLNVKLEHPAITCSYHEKNNECIEHLCQYYPKK